MRSLLLLGLALVACDGGPGRVVTPLPDATPRLDRGLPMADASVPDPDAGDAQLDAGDAQAVDAMPDQGPVVEASAPDLDEVAALTLPDGRQWVLWRDRATVIGAHLDAGEFEPFEAPIDTPPAVPTRIEAHRAGPVPYVVIGVEEGPIRVRVLDDLDAPTLSLDLVGEPRAAAVLDGTRWVLVVIGTDADGNTATQVVREGETGDTLVAPTRLPNLELPASVATVPTGVVLRYPDAGQCVRLNAMGAEPQSFPCRVGAGGLLGTAVGHPKLLFTRRAGLVSRYEVAPLFGSTIGYPILHTNAFTPRLAPSDGTLLRVGEVYEGENQGRLQLALMATDSLWFSQATWGSWPYPNARTVVHQGDTGVVIEFDEQGTPSTTALALEESRRQTPYNIDRDPACVPRPETCDGEDQDCDGRIDNNQCCARARDLNARTISLADAEVADTRNIVEQVMVGQIGIEPGWQVFLKLDRPEPWFDGWYGYLLRQGANWRAGARAIANPARPEQAVDDPDAHGPATGLRAIPVGAYTALLGRDSEGELRVWWSHAEANPADGVPIGSIPLDTPDPDGVAEGQGRGPCADFQDANGEPGGDGLPDPAPPGADPMWPILAAQPANHYGREASLLLVCPRRILRIYPFDPEPEYIAFPQRSPLAWATLTPHADGDFRLAMAFISSVGEWLIDAYHYDPESGLLRAVPLPLTIQNGPQNGAALGHPIWLGSHDVRPVVQLLRTSEGEVDAVRVLSAYDDDIPWQSVRLPPDVDQVTYAPRTGLLLASAPHCSDAEPCQQRAFYAIDLSYNEQMNLWPDRPTLVSPPELRHWQLLDSSAPLAMFAENDDGLGVYTQKIVCLQ